VFYLGYGYEGVAFSTNITYLMNYLLPVIYISTVEGAVKEDSWHFINRDSFVGFTEYLRFGIPSILMTALEFWCYEIINMMAGYIGVLELGASAICFNIICIGYMFISGFSFVSSTLVGNSLGASRPADAKIYVNISISIAIIISLLIGILILLFKKQLAYFFTEDAELADQIISTLPVMAVMNLFDSIQGMCQGVIKAMGYQKYATYTSLV